MKTCYRCAASVSLDSIGVRDVCDRCRSYLHCCRNCELYEPGLHNDCREPNAELVADKEQGNFCDFFRFSTRQGISGGSQAADARARLDSLFRKR